MHHFFFRKYRASVESTNIEKLSRGSRLYKEKVSDLEENINPLITENKAWQIK